MSITTCPCCNAADGVHLGNHEEPEALVKTYRCHECRSTWQAIDYGTGGPVLGLVAQSEAGEKARLKIGSKRSEMKAHAKRGAATTKSRHKGLATA